MKSKKNANIFFTLLNQTEKIIFQTPFHAMFSIFHVNLPGLNFFTSKFSPE